MIWGETAGEKMRQDAARFTASQNEKARICERTEHYMEWHVHDVWFWPVKLEDGRRAWGRNIGRRFINRDDLGYPTRPIYAPWTTVVREQMEGTNTTSYGDADAEADARCHPQFTPMRVGKPLPRPVGPPPVIYHPRLNVTLSPGEEP